MRRILVVDDHADFRNHLCRLLEADGFQVVAAADSGRAALKAAAELAPDLAIVDIGLPDMDGIALAAELRRLDPAPRVLLTSSRDATSYGSRLATVPDAPFVPKDELDGATISGALGEAIGE
jgi:DNA-binding NarL/FixJ family response regulator